VALFCGFVTSWSFIIPVRKAQRFLDQVAAGNFGRHITVANRDELGVLADRMNHRSDELHRFDVEQRRAATELVPLNDQLAQASKAKSAVLPTMTPDL